MKIFFTITLALVAIIGIMSFELLTPSGKAGYSGSPGEGNCTACHNGTVNSGTATVEITADPSVAEGYVPGATYTMNIIISNSPAPVNKRFGLDAEILLASGANAGTMAVMNMSMMKIMTNKVGGNTRNNMVHTGSQNVGPNGQTFSFKWTAPAAGSGVATVYCSVMAANNDGDTGGDLVYTRSLAIPEKTVGVLDNNQISNLSIFPNPTDGKFQIDMGNDVLSANSTVEIYDSEGKMVYRSTINSPLFNINLSNLLKGAYFVKVYNNNKIQSGKVLIN